MQVSVLDDTQGLEALSGVVVVLDIFRASNTIIALLAAGAREVILLAELEQALALKAANPDWLLAGERGGLPPAGFDLGNSPMAAGRMDLAGRRVILTTSAGTQAVRRLGRAAAVFYASFANAGALCRRLARMNPPQVHLLPMGFEARQPAVEDSLAADFLQQSLLGRPPDFGPTQRQLLDCPGAQRLRALGQQDDLDFCTALDSHQLLPLVHFTPQPAARPAP